MEWLIIFGVGYIIGAILVRINRCPGKQKRQEWADERWKLKNQAEREILRQRRLDALLRERERLQELMPEDFQQMIRSLEI